MFISSKSGDTLPDQVKNILAQGVDELVKSYEKTIAELKARADTAIPKIRTDIEKCRHVGCLYGVSSYLETGGSWGRKRTPDELQAHVEGLVAEALAKDTAIHEKNKEAIENNKIVARKIEQLMLSIGIPDSYRERDHKSRAYTPKYIQVSAGYKTDCNKITVHDDYETQVHYAKSKRDELATYVTKMKAEVEKAAAEQKKKVDEQKRLRKFAIVAGRYGVDDESDYRDLLDKILEKNQYLRLSHYLVLNRNDWTDGYNYAECGLRTFSCTTPLDREIYQEISGIIERATDIDGRVFRDCEHNYDSIMGLVTDEQLLADYHLVNQWVAEKEGF